MPSEELQTPQEPGQTCKNCANKKDIWCFDLKNPSRKLWRTCFNSIDITAVSFSRYLQNTSGTSWAPLCRLVLVCGSLKCWTCSSHSKCMQSLPPKHPRPTSQTWLEICTIAWLMTYSMTPEHDSQEIQKEVS